MKTQNPVRVSILVLIGWASCVFLSWSELSRPVTAQDLKVLEKSKLGIVKPVSYTHLTLPTTPYV